MTVISADSISSLPSLALFGGTFNPVHHGHLRMALEVAETIGVESMRLVPAARPPHRAQPLISVEHRLAMLRLAVKGDPMLSVDDRELARAGLSFTIDTVASVRDEVGPDVSICLCMGVDAYSELHRWHRWRELSDYVHIVIITRPGWRLNEAPELIQWREQRQLKKSTDLSSSAAGSCLLLELTSLTISSTHIRQLVASGLSPRYLLPDPVYHYMQEHGLYTSLQENNHDTGN
ncbi:MAG: nicotinate-nucleotide adenylyltransferase [Pseudomonadales bacterium]